MMTPGAFALACRCGKAVAACTAHDATALDAARVCLPDYAEPASYDMLLHLHMDEDRYDGHIEIVVDVVTATAELQVHSKDLELVVVKCGGHSASGSVAYNEDDGIATLAFDGTLPVGQHTLVIDFKGILNDLMCGLSRMKCVTVSLPLLLRPRAAAAATPTPPRPRHYYQLTRLASLGTRTSTATRPRWCRRSSRPSTPAGAFRAGTSRPASAPSRARCACRAA